MKSKKKLAIIIVLTCGCLWGLSGVLGDMLFRSSNISVGLLSSLRMLFAGTAILIILFIKDGKKIFDLWKTKDMIIPFFIFTILGLMSVQYTYFAAVKSSNAATATVLQYTYPIIILICTSISSRRIPKGYEVVAIVMAFVGVVLISTHGHLTSLNISLSALLWGTLSAFCFVFYTMYPKKLYKKVGLFVVMGWAFLIGGLILLIITKSYLVKFNYNFHSIALLLSISVFGTLIPFSIYGKGVEWLGNVMASLFVTIEPVFSAILAIVLLKTNFTKIDVLGFCCIIAAIQFVAYKELKQSKKDNVQLHKKYY